MSVYPGGWQRIPVEVRRFLTARLLEQQLQIHDGAEGLIRFLYAGKPLPNLPLSRTYAMTAAEFWPHVEADAAAWNAKHLAARTTKETP